MTRCTAGLKQLTLCLSRGRPQHFGQMLPPTEHLLTCASCPGFCLQLAKRFAKSCLKMLVLSGGRLMCSRQAVLAVAGRLPEALWTGAAMQLQGRQRSSEARRAAAPDDDRGRVPQAAAAPHPGLGGCQAGQLAAGCHSHQPGPQPRRVCVLSLLTIKVSKLRH